jgi:hypothetical protein
MFTCLFLFSLFQKSLSSWRHDFQGNFLTFIMSVGTRHKNRPRAKHKQTASNIFITFYILVHIFYHELYVICTLFISNLKLCKYLITLVAHRHLLVGQFPDRSSRLIGRIVTDHCHVG